MKKVSLSIITLLLVLSSCTKTNVTVKEDDKVLNAITSYMLDESKSLFGDGKFIEIPTPYIVSIDDSDENDIKVYGNFYIYGYELKNTIFYNVNGASQPGCFHIKNDDSIATVIKKEIAEDGSNNWSSLVRICNGDESLAKKILNPGDELKEDIRIEAVKKYATDNNINITAIKDYGWPIIIFDTASGEEFVYDFYYSYFEEVQQIDYLNDMVERLSNLKKKYMTEDIIDRLDTATENNGADMVMNAQDATDEMVKTLKVKKIDDKYNVTFDNGTDTPTSINVQIEKNNRKIVYIDTVKK